MSTTLKYSRQREALIELIKSVKNHPTAEWLYTQLKKEYPNLSMATVYRNLRLLCDTGEVVRIDIGDGAEHFDAYTVSHPHFICSSCHSLLDIDVPDADKLPEIATKFNDIIVDKHSLVFYGLCPDCK